MSYEIICPYCFQKMKDDEVLFRSEKVNQGDCDALPDDYYDVKDFEARYRGADKKSIMEKIEEWEFFAEGEDEEYEEFWSNFNGTTEYNPADDVLGVKAYMRKIIDPSNENHQKYLVKQDDGSYFIRDTEGMVIQIELNTHEKCNRRVCRHCHNPLPDNYGKDKVRFAAVIGITGAGKTIYLSQLLHKMNTYAVKAGLSAIVTTPSVSAFLENNSIAAKQPLPSSTPSTRLQQPLFYEMVRASNENRRITETFVLYDVAGEVFKEPSLVNKFAPFIEHVDGVIMLIDPMEFGVISGASIDGRALEEPTTVLNIIHHIISHGNENEKCSIPFAVCISKIDTEIVQRVLDNDLLKMLLDDVHGIKNKDGFYMPMFNAKEYNPIGKALNDFIQQNEIVLAQQMQINYSAYAYFAFTALGCDVKEGQLENGEKYQYPVGPIVPKRVEEPILWLFNQFKYIDQNDRIFTPSGEKIYCPSCGSDATCELPNGGMNITKGFWPFKKIMHVNMECSACGYKWENGCE